MRTGLAPLLQRLTPAEGALRSAAGWALVRGGDLAARLESAHRLDALHELVDARGGRPLAVLKGMALCLREYPEPHLRPMRDIDVLVDASEVEDTVALLRRLGYRREPVPESYAGHHHAHPLIHPRTRVCVEVHHRLFSAGPLGADPLFSAESVEAALEPFESSGRLLRRLRPELQIAHVAAHWAASPKLLTGRGGLLPVLDLALLMKTHAVDGARLAGRLRGSAAAPAVYALVAYAAARGLLSPAPELLTLLRGTQRAFGPRTLRVLFGLVDRCMGEGRRLPVPGARTVEEALWRSLFLAGPPLLNLARAPVLLARDLARARATTRLTSRARRRE